MSVSDTCTSALSCDVAIQSPSARPSNAICNQQAQRGSESGYANCNQSRSCNVATVPRQLFSGPMALHRLTNPLLRHGPGFTRSQIQLPRRRFSWLRPTTRTRSFPRSVQRAQRRSIKCRWLVACIGATEQTRKTRFFRGILLAH